MADSRDQSTRPNSRVSLVGAPPLSAQQKHSTYKAYRDSGTILHNGSYQDAVPGLEGWNDIPDEVVARMNEFREGVSHKSEGGDAPEDYIGNKNEYIMESIKALFNDLNSSDRDSPDPEPGLLATIGNKLYKLEERLNSNEISTDVMDKLLKISRCES